MMYVVAFGPKFWVNMTYRTTLEQGTQEPDNVKGLDDNDSVSRRF